MALMIEVNLLPIEYRKVRKDLSWVTDRRTIWSAVALLAFGVLSAVYYVGMNATIGSKESDIARLRMEISQFDTVKTQITRLEDLKSKQEAKNQSLRSISVSKKRWVRILEDVNASLPAHTWLLSIKEKEGENKVTLVCRTFVFQEVAGFMLQLERRPFFKAPTLEQIEQAPNTDKNLPAAFAFTLHCPLDENISKDEAATTQPEAGGANGH